MLSSINSGIYSEDKIIEAEGYKKVEWRKQVYCRELLWIINVNGNESEGRN